MPAAWVCIPLADYCLGALGSALLGAWAFLYLMSAVAFYCVMRHVEVTMVRSGAAERSSRDTLEFVLAALTWPVPVARIVGGTLASVPEIWRKAVRKTAEKHAARNAAHQQTD